jgi:indolepyruvate ferredoxin oxidoreductase
VAKVVITTDDVARTKAGSIPRSVEIRDRDEVLDVQRELASVSGVTVMIHDQACATELRRARKRGLVAPPRQVVVINERVCEGCGDCQTKSNCLSLQTISTPFGPKTTVDEETCNVDLSCLAGDCPAFALVEPSSSSGSTEASSTGRAAEAEPALAPEAPVRSLEASTTVRLAGVGGTGVVTAAHLLARAALIDGVEAWGVDQTGMSQKAGTVISDLRIGPGAVERSNVLGTDEVDVLVACDLLAATARACLDGLSPSRTRVVGSTATSLTGPMVLGRTDRSIDTDALCAALEERAIPDGTSFVDTEALLGRAGISRSASNVALLGIVHQSGLLPLSTDALRGAIEQNGVAVEENLSAFELGRAWAAGLVALEAELEPLTTTTAALDLPDAARAHLGALADELVQYQSPAQAAILLERAEAAWRVEALLGGDGTLCTAVADGLFKFQAYKDEYEVARLLLDHPASGGKVTWLLHPPAMRSRGLKRKLHLGPRSRPLLRALKAGRRLRGTRLDPFGRTPLRRLERQLIDEQLELIDRVLGLVDAERLAAAAELCRLPLEVRGYESVKERSIERFVSKRDQLLAALEAKVLIDERSA